MKFVRITTFNLTEEVRCYAGHVPQADFPHTVFEDGEIQGYMEPVREVRPWIPTNERVLIPAELVGAICPAVDKSSWNTDLPIYVEVFAECQVDDNFVRATLDVVNSRHTESILVPLIQIVPIRFASKVPTLTTISENQIIFNVPNVSTHPVRIDLVHILFDILNSRLSKVGTVTLPVDRISQPSAWKDPQSLESKAIQVFRTFHPVFTTEALYAISTSEIAKPKYR